MTELQPMRGLFVTATGTGAGKTTVTAALARALHARGEPVVALKPIETGVDPEPAYARVLAEACGRPELATLPGFHRARLPLSPYACALEGEAPLALEPLLVALRSAAGGHLALVEGAGGLLVPIDRERTVADLARALDLPLLLVAPDRLGVLSDVLCAVEAAEARGLRIAALVLNATEPARAERDPSPRTNGRILGERLPRVPIVQVPHGEGILPDALVELAASVTGRSTPANATE
jgi:dethiobiotin synthetase